MAAHAHATKKPEERADSFDVSKARLVGIGPRRPARLSLRSLREAARKTQAQVAKASGLAQPVVSNLETAESLDDRQVLTVRRYLRALGDDLELVATSKLGHRIGIAPPASAVPRQEPSAKPVPHDPGAFTRILWIRLAELGGQWKALGSREALPPSQATALDMAWMIPTLEALDPAALAELQQNARKAILRAVARGKSPARDEGEELLKITRDESLTPERVEELLCLAIPTCKTIAAQLGLKREVDTLHHGQRRKSTSYAPPQPGGVAARAVAKWRKLHRDREGLDRFRLDADTRAGELLQHALEAMGLKRDRARVAAGLKKK